MNSHLSMMARIGYEFYRSHLVGNSCAANMERFHRMQKPKPGDLVIELSTAGWWMRSEEPNPGPFAYLKVENAIGIVENITNEPYPREEPWDEQIEGKPEPLEQCFYIRLLYDGSIFRWTNARLVAILPVEGWPL